MDKFLVCSCCEASWDERDDILDDPWLELVGYQVDLAGLSRGFFLFNHMVEGCGSTIAVEVEQFADLKGSPRFEENQYGTELCSESQGRMDYLSRCNRPCRNAWLRDLAMIIKGRLTDRL